MATYEIDGIDYEIDESVDLVKTIEDIRLAPSHIEAQNTIGRALNENAAGAISAVGDLTIGLPSMLAGAGGRASAALSGESPEQAKQIGGQVADWFNPLTRSEAHMQSRDSSTYQALMKPFEMIGEGWEKIGEVAGNPPSGEWGDPELGRQFGGVAGLGADLTMAAGIGRAGVKMGTDYRQAQYKAAEDARIARVKEQQRQQAAAEEAARLAEMERMAGPYRPIDVEKAMTLAERDIEGPKQPYAPESSLLELAKEPLEPRPLTDPQGRTIEEFPFNYKAHENAVPFELRQEVLQRPETQDRINYFREQFAKLQEQGKDTTKLQEQFGEFMRQYGIRNAEEATGLRRPLYESSRTGLTETQLPIQKTDPFRGPGKKQAGYIDIDLIVGAGKGVKELLKTIGQSRTYEKFKGTFEASELKRLYKESTDPLSRSRAVWMSPEDFLRMALPLHKPYELKTSSIKKGLDTEAGLRQVPYLLMDDMGNGRYFVKGHEGRHRAIALAKAGVELMPVELRGRTETARNRYGEYSGRLFSEDGRNTLPMPERIKFEENSDPFKGPGKRQVGSVELPSEFDSYKKWYKETYGDAIPDAVIKEAFENYKNPKQPKFESFKNEGTVATIEKIPGFKGDLRDLLSQHLRSVEEATPEIQAAADIAGDVITKAGLQLFVGGKQVSLYHKNPLIKLGVDHINVAEQAMRRNVDKLLYDKETGIVNAVDQLNGKEQVQLIKSFIENEGVKYLTTEERLAQGFTEKMNHAYDRMVATFKVLWDLQNELRVKKLPPRPGYFPAKFVGDFFVEVKAPKEGAPGMMELVGLYSANSKKAVAEISRRIKEDRPEWTVGPVQERRPFIYKRGSELGLNVYKALTDALEANDPRAKVLSDLIKEYGGYQAKFQAGYFQHLKPKKGIKGSTGRNEYKTDLQNAQDALTAAQDYVIQAIEYNEIRRLEPTISKLLDNEKFPNQPNAQSYLSEYWDRFRGIDNKVNQAIGSAITAFAHQFGVSGGAVRSVGHKARTLFMLKMLGFNNARFLTAQFLQPGQFIAQNILRLESHGVKLTQRDWAVAVANGAYITGQRWLGIDKVKPRFREALQWAEDNGVVEPRFFEDVQTYVGKIRKNVWEALNGQMAIRFSEQTARNQAFITFFDLLDGKGLSKAEHLQLAADITRQTMVDYRPHEKPLLYQNLGVLGAAISPFTTFKHNNWGQIAIALKELVDLRKELKEQGRVIELTKDKKGQWEYRRLKFAAEKAALVLGVTASMSFLYSGLMGLPFREDADTLIYWLNQMGIEVPSIASTIMKSDMPVWVSHGIFSSITGSDLTTTLSQPSLIPDRGSEVAPFVAEAADMVKKTWTAGIDRTKQAGAAALHAWLPKAYEGFFELGSQQENGVIPNPNKGMQGDIRRSTDKMSKDWWKRYFAMRPIEEAREKQAGYEFKKSEGMIEAQKSRYYQRAYEKWKDGKDFSSEVKNLSEYGVTSQMLIQQFKDKLRAERTTEKERAAGGLVPRTPSQARKYRERYQYVR